MTIFHLYLHDSEKISWHFTKAAIVRAPTYQRARELASAACGREGPEPWLDPARSTVVDAEHGPEEILMRDDEPVLYG